MENFPLTSLFNLTAAGVCLFTAVKLYLTNKGEIKDVKVLYFFYSFVFITIYLLINGLPLIAIKNPFSIAVTSSLFLPFLLIAGMFFCLTPINFTKYKKYEKFFISFLLLSVLVSSILIFLGLGKVLSFDGKSFEELSRPEHHLVVYGMIVSGISFIISLLLAVIFYFRYAFRHKKNSIVFGKSLMIGIGCFFFMLAVFSNYVIGVTPEKFLTASMIASIFFMIGAISFISSTLYKGEKKYKLK
jgi:hypothetical protein